MQRYLQIFDISEIKRCENYLAVSPKTGLFYSSFSLLLTENLHKQRNFLERWSSCFVYNIFLKNV